MYSNEFTITLLVILEAFAGDYNVSININKQSYLNAISGGGVMWTLFWVQMNRPDIGS